MNFMVSVRLFRFAIYTILYNSEVVPSLKRLLVSLARLLV